MVIFGYPCSLWAGLGHSEQHFGGETMTRKGTYECVALP